MSDDATTLDLAGRTVDLDRGQVTTDDGGTSRLSTREVALLRYFAARPGEIITRDELLVEVWGFSPQVISRAADITMGRLRKKLEDDPSNPQHLITIHGTGYRFVPLEVQQEAPPTEAPLGEVALVFTDIEGSTRLWEALDEDFGPVLAQHNRILRSEIARHEGYEVKTEGDAFMVSFSDPENAVRFCLDAQVRLLEADWPNALPVPDSELGAVRVRMGVHMGAPICKTDPTTGRMDYLGPVVNRAARVSDAAHGGQVVLSAVVFSAVGEQLEDAVFKDLGEHALKGLEEHEHIHQALPATLSERVFPRLRTPDLRRTNLPARITSFRGREDELDELARRFKNGERLVTMLGTGGVGKTRLAQRFGAEQLASYPGGVWFCDLSETTNADEVLTAVARALEVPLTQSNPAVQLGHTIAGRDRVLLILDNLEQVIEEAAPIVARWVSGAPKAHFLVTSRERLRIEGESALSVEPLPTQTAIDLFGDRASRASTKFALGEANLVSIEEIVQKLDGLPLAVELAAARVGMLAPAEMLERMELNEGALAPTVSYAGLVASERRDLSDRERTLRGAIDWSWNLLEPFEQAALAQCSVFRGGFSLEAAEAILDLSEWPIAPKTMQVVKALVDQSLLKVSEPIAGQRRFGMVRSIHAYATEQLHPGGATDAAHQRLATFFSAFGTQDALRALLKQGEVDQRHRLALNLDNLIVGVRHGTAETAPLCCMAAMKVVAMKGPVSLGVDIATEVLALPELPRTLQMRLELERTKCLRISGRMDEAREMTQDTAPKPAATPPSPSAVLPKAGASSPPEASAEGGAPSDDSAPAPEERSESSEDAELELLEAERLMEQGHLERQKGNFAETNRLYAEALGTFRRLGARELEGDAVSGLGNAHLSSGQTETAIQYYRAALEIYLELGDQRGQAIVSGNLATAFKAQGHYGDAVAQHLQALDIYLELGDKSGEGVVLGNLGLIDIAHRRYEPAVKRFREALEIHRQVENKSAQSMVLTNLGLALYRLQRIDEAEGALREAILIGDDAAVPIPAGLARSCLALLRAEQGHLDQAQALLDTGEPLVAPSPEGYAWFLCMKGQVQHLAGQAHAARDSLKQAEDLAEQLKIPEESHLAKDIAELAALLDGESDDDSAPAPGEGSKRSEDAELESLEAERWMELGRIERGQRNLDAAFNWYQKALVIFRKHGNRRHEGDALGNIANLCEGQSQYGRAIELYTAAIDIHRELGNTPSEGIVLGNLGIALLAQGKAWRAIECFTTAIDIHRELGNTRSEGMTLGNLGMAWATRGELERAAELYTAAIDMLRQVGDRRHEGLFHEILGNLSCSQGQYERAIGHYTTALDIFREIGVRHAEGTTLGNLGNTLFKLLRLDEAEAAFRQAIGLCDEKYPMASGAFRGSLALLLAQQAQPEEAQTLLDVGERQVTIETVEHAKFLCKKGQVQLIDDKPDAAQASLKQAEDIASELNVNEHSDVTKAIAELTALLEASSAEE